MTVLTKNQRAALNYQNHIALTANAGSGKTFVLARRYIEIAFNENINLRNIAAITFTDKAAGELYKKISNEVNKRLDETTDPGNKAKLERIRRQLVSANISTIHSFCIDILRDFPIEAQIDANFTPIDKTTSDELIQLSIEEVIKASLGNEQKSQQLKYLIRVFASKNLFSEILFSLIEKRKSFLKLTEELYSNTEQEIGKFFYEVFKQKVSSILDKDFNTFLKSVYKINEAVLQKTTRSTIAVETGFLLSRLNKGESFEERLSNLVKLKEMIITRSNCSIKKQGYLKDPERELLDAEISIVEEYFCDFDCFSVTDDHKTLEEELAVFGKMLSTAFIDVLNVYTAKKKQKGYLDFEDILIKTRDILTFENVSASLSEKYKYIMIDEYQDTNEIQFDIIMPILDNLRHGNLFVVGDEKQSIYMFRDAELAIFNKTKNEIAESSGREYVLTLPDSFRMSPEICLFTNHVFRNLFKDPIEEFNEVNYTDIVCAKDDSESGGVEFLLADKEKEVEEGEVVAAKIMQLISRTEDKINPGEIAILCRKRRSFSELEKVLNKYNLPFTVLGGKGFYQQQIIYDVFNYLSFLLNSNNDAALAGVLRSPFFSVSDAELFEISLIKGNSFWEKFFRYASDKDHIKRYYNILRENIGLARTLSFPELLRKILNESSFLAVISSRKNAEQELANIDKLISIAISFANQNFKTLYDFVSYLETAMNTQEDEGHAVINPEDNTIKIMTVHQSKGLEFKCVFLYNSHDTSQRDSAKAKDISLDKELGFLTALPFRGNFFSEYRSAPVVTLYNYIIKRKNLAEIKRLLYVAVTRAKNYLFISASHKNYNFKKESFISLLVKGLNTQLPAEHITITDQITLLKYTEEKGYENPQREMQLKIPVTQDVLPESVRTDFILLQDLTDHQINTGIIQDNEEEEIISATKIAVFNQCPLKYQLTYEFGYLNLFKEYKGAVAEYDFTSGEDEDVSISDIKGNIVHELLEKEYTLTDLSEQTELLIKKYVETSEVLPEKVEGYRNIIVDELSVFMGSELYSYLKSFPVHYNEFEIYCKNGDHYLYGVIDRLVIDNKKAIIIDYKTDNIKEDEIDSRVNNYLPQLKFYAYLVSKHFPDIEEFELRLVFIKLPEYKVVKLYTKQDTVIFNNDISAVINRIRNKSFTKNLKHCFSCYYAVNKVCIKQ